MDKIIKRSYYTVMVILGVLVITLLVTGCGNRSGDDSDTPDFVFQPEVISFPMPEGVSWIDNITIAGDSAYFTAMREWNEDAIYTASDIYTMDLDGTNARTLPDYDLGIEISADATNGSMQIYSISVDRSGNVWVAERGEFFYFPGDFDEDDDEFAWERWNNRIIVQEFTRVRQLDGTGSEILSIDISHVSAGQEWFYISAFTTDADNNIYIGTESGIHVFDSRGGTLFVLDAQWVDRFVNLQDGTVAFMGWGLAGRALSKIDVAGKRLGEAIDLPNNAHNVYTGNDEFSLIFTDNIGMYGIEAESGETVLLLNWIDSDMVLDGLGSITFLQDGRILATSQTWGNDGPRQELIFLTKTPYSELPERIVLTMATFHLDWNIRSAIVQYNRLSTTHRIRVTDYSEFNTEDDWQAGLTRLSTEIISGNVPDLLDVSNLPFKQYAAKGLLMDLYPLIDSDPEFNRSDFVESAFRAVELDGSLYQIFSSFHIITMLGHPSVVGSYPGWNMEEFVAVLNAYPEADYPLGQGLTKMDLLQALFMFSMDDYVDWDAGKVSFDSSDFMTLLEFANTLPNEFDWENYIPSHELIIAGRQIIMATGVSFTDEIQMNRALFGGEIVYKGLPAENRNGFALSTNTGFAISSKCKDADGAWAFIRTFLSEDWQTDNIWYGIPMNRHVLEKKLKEAMDEERSGSSSIDGFLVEMKPLTQADVDQFMALINSVSRTVGQDDALWMIISESAERYFSGQVSVQDAVRVIQNRASTYIAEQS